MGTFIEMLWNYQWVKYKTTLTKDTKGIMYKRTIGIIDRANKLFMAVQLESISSWEEKITPELINRVADEKFKGSLDKQKGINIMTTILDLTMQIEIRFLQNWKVCYYILVKHAIKDKIHIYTNICILIDNSMGIAYQLSTMIIKKQKYKLSETYQLNLANTILQMWIKGSQNGFLF